MYSIETRQFGQYVRAYRLVNKQGMQVVLTDLGARIVHILLPVEEKGGLRNVSLACSSAEDYITNGPYVGASIVPVAGRLFTKQLQIRGQALQLLENGPGYSLNSGPKAANLQIWETNCISATNRIVFSICLADGYNGFPGPISVQASYQLCEDNTLEVHYQANSERPTLFNPTNHVFFNLSGRFQESIGQHRLQVSADRVLAYDRTGKPEKIRWVHNTPFDYRNGRLFDDGLQSHDSQIKLFGGFDHFWYLNNQEKAATVISPDRKIRLRVATNQDGIVIYTYNKNQPHLATKHGAFSLECLASKQQGQLLVPHQTIHSWARYSFEY
ncbi:aldose epimerase family protein [Streptococcus suis]